MGAMLWKRRHRRDEVLDRLDEHLARSNEILARNTEVTEHLFRAIGEMAQSMRVMQEDIRANTKATLAMLDRFQNGGATA
jgi:hypothetical protein